jgi:hypothetical protein
MSEQQLDVNSAWMIGTDRCASTGYIHSKRLEQRMEKKLEAAHTARFGTPRVHSLKLKDGVVRI